MSAGADRSRFYRALLRVLPAPFRARQGESMEQAFVSLVRGARERHVLWIAWLYVAEAWDLVRTGWQLRWRARRAVRSSKRAHRVGRPAGIRAGSGGVVDDLRLAVRVVVRHRSFFVVAVGTLALGVGATTATYSALKSVVLDPLPFPGSERVVLVWRTIGSGWFSPNEAEVEALTADREVFEDVALFNSETVTLTGMGSPAQLAAVRTGPTLADFMSLRPSLGRGFAASEFAGDGGRVLLLSDALWRGPFGGTRDVLGRSLSVNGETWTIIGVMPSKAVRPNGMPGRVDLWLPLPEVARNRQPIARLRPGVSLETATAHVGELFRRVSRTEAYGARVTKATALRSGALLEPLRVLMAAVTLLLLIACVNVSNLLLHRAAGRWREIAVLCALGAPRGRLVRQCLMESLILALAGGTLGTLLASGSLRAAERLRPAELTVLDGLRLDGSALFFTLLVSTCAGLLFGLLPALRAARADAASSLARAPREGSQSHRRFRWVLVAVEVALSFTLLVGAAQLILSLRRASARDPGFQAAGLYDLTITLPPWRHAEQASRQQVLEQITQRVLRLPAVLQAAMGEGSPPQSGIYFGVVQVEGKPAEPEASMFHGTAISPQYLDVVGQPLIAGRSFTVTEMTDSADVVVLGETSARRLFPDGAIGRRFSFGGGPPKTVIGVVRDASLAGLRAGPDVEIAYWPMATLATTVHLLIRTKSEDPGLAAELRNVVRAIEADALVEVQRAADLLAQSLARERFTTTLLSCFAGLALLLSAVGLYSVLSQVVTSRTHEIGVRASLGADARRIRRLVLRSGATATLVGLGAGSALLLGGLQLLRSRVFGLTDSEPRAWALAALVLCAVAFVAVWRPAQRAARVDPMLAMRAD